MAPPCPCSVGAVRRQVRPRLGAGRALVLALWTLGACQGLSERGTAPPPEAPGAVDQRATDAREADAPPPRPRSKPAPPPAAVSRPGPPRPPQPPARVALDLASLEGLTPGEVGRRLGRPWWRHDEPPARVWTYVAGPCILQLFFYPELQFEERRVLAYDLDPGSEAAGAAEQCLIALQRNATEGVPAATPTGPGPVRPTVEGAASRANFWAKQGGPV